MAAMSLVLVLAHLPSLALGDYLVTSYHNTQGQSSSSCLCSASSLAGGASYQAGGCTAKSSYSSLITCINSSYYTTSSYYTNTACSGTTSSSQVTKGGCSCSYGSATSVTCVTSSANLPSLATLDSPVMLANFSGKCPSTDPTVLPSISTATSLTSIGSRCSAGPRPGGGAIYRSIVCGAWGMVTAYYSDASCSSAPLFTYPFYSSIDISTCSSSSGGSSASYCTTPTAAAPDTMFSARAIPKCKDAINPAPLPTATLSCFVGVISSSGSSNSYVFSGMPTESGTSAPSVACYAATVSCSQQMWPNQYCDSPSTILRIFGGASSAADLASLNSLHFFGGMAPPRDLVLCTGNKCNSPSPAVDACAIVSPPYTPLTCGAPLAIIAAPSPIACYSNVGSGSTLTPTLQSAAQPGALACGATTVNCPATLSLIRSFPPSSDKMNIFLNQVQKLCLGVTGAVRLYGDSDKISYDLLYILLSLSPPPSLEGFFSPAYTGRAYFNDFLVCTEPGCNNPATDACALASAPVSVTASFSGLPDSAADATGKLTPAAVTLLTASLSTAVQSSACATCSVTVTKVLDTSKNTVVFNASRRRELALGALAVTFAVAGASTQTLAGVAAAATAPAFSQAATKALVSTGGSAYASVAVSMAPASTNSTGSAGSAGSASSAGPMLIGLVGLVGLLFVGVAVYCACSKKKAAAGKVVDMPQQGMAMPQQQAVVMRTQV